MYGKFEKRIEELRASSMNAKEELLIVERLMSEMEDKYEYKALIWSLRILETMGYDIEKLASIQSRYRELTERKDELNDTIYRNANEIKKLRQDWRDSRPKMDAHVFDSETYVYEAIKKDGFIGGRLS